MTALPASPSERSPVERSSRRARTAFVALWAAASVLIAVLVAILVFLWSPVHALSSPFVPSEATGHLVEPASVDDEHLPAISNLDTALRQALHSAAEAAALDGIEFGVTSGWRSRAYQQWLLDDAVDVYGSEEVARQYVASPDCSSHVTGDAVDIGPVDAQFWLIEHGAQWGLCQIYANERWHFERVTDAGGTCPALRADAAG